MKLGAPNLNHIKLIIQTALIVTGLVGVGHAQSNRYTDISGAAAPRTWRQISIEDSKHELKELRTSKRLEQIAEWSAMGAIREEGRSFVDKGEIYVTVLDARDPHYPQYGSYRGRADVYPASVVKIPYMVTTFDQVETGLIPWDEELRADLQDMIIFSDNVATNAIVDRITGTGYGQRLGGPEWDAFKYKRERVNRYMRSLGLNDIRAMQKTFGGDTPFFGRDPQLLGDKRRDHYDYSNLMTTEDTAKLLYLIWRRAVVSPEACEEMLKLMQRGPGAQEQTTFSDIRPMGAILYSKSGWTNIEQHDAGIFDLGPEGAIIIVVFTINRGNQEKLRVVEKTGELVLQRVRENKAIMGGPDPDSEMPRN